MKKKTLPSFEQFLSLIDYCSQTYDFPCLNLIIGYHYYRLIWSNCEIGVSSRDWRVLFYFLSDSIHILVHS